MSTRWTKHAQAPIAASTPHEAKVSKGCNWPSWSIRGRPGRRLIYLRSANVGLRMRPWPGRRGLSKTLIMKPAAKARLRLDNPAAGHSIPMQRRRLHEGDVLTMEQIHRLIAEVPRPYKPVVWLIILAGLRPAELCGVRVRDLDMSSRTLHVSQTVLPLHGFDNERFQLVTGFPKTTAGDRRIPIPDRLCDEIVSVLEARANKRAHRRHPMS